MVACFVLGVAKKCGYLERKMLAFFYLGSILANFILKAGLHGRLFCFGGGKKMWLLRKILAFFILEAF